MEEKRGVLVTITVQSDHSAIGDVDEAAGTVGSGVESFTTHFDCHGFASDCHCRSVIGQDASGENTGISHDLPLFFKIRRPGDGSAGRDTNIPTVDRGETTIESNGFSRMDSECFTHTVVGERARKSKKEEQH